MVWEGWGHKENSWFASFDKAILNVFRISKDNFLYLQQLLQHLFKDTTGATCWREGGLGVQFYFQEHNCKASQTKISIYFFTSLKVETDTQVFRTLKK